MAGYPFAWFSCRSPRDPLAEAVADLLLIGFHGKTPASPSGRLLARQAARGQVGAVFFVAQNIGTSKAVAKLVRMFSYGPVRPLLAIDHEGGIVQRLTPVHGFTRVPAARKVAEKMSPQEAEALYGLAGHELAKAGFHVTLGPVLDIHHSRNPAIGKHGRAYSSDPQTIAVYGNAFVKGFLRAGILSAAKHFPGHGRAMKDSHDGSANISKTWQEDELEPFTLLIASDTPPAMIMTGHLRLDRLDASSLPATISPNIVKGMLRKELSYDGVIVTDDIDMGAISGLMSRKEAMIRSLAAGSDLIMIKNLFRYDPFLPRHAVSWVRQAVKQGRLSEEAILRSAARVRAMRCYAPIPFQI